MPRHDRPPVVDSCDSTENRSGVSLHVYLTRLIWLSVLPVVLLAAYLAIDHVLIQQGERIDGHLYPEALESVRQALQELAERESGD